MHSVNRIIFSFIRKFACMLNEKYVLSCKYLRFLIKLTIEHNILGKHI